MFTNTVSPSLYIALCTLHEKLKFANAEHRFVIIKRKKSTFCFWLCKQGHDVNVHFYVNFHTEFSALSLYLMFKKVVSVFKNVS